MLELRRQTDRIPKINISLIGRGKKDAICKIKTSLINNLIRRSKKKIIKIVPFITYLKKICR
jgi:hypothetical protein